MIEKPNYNIYGVTSPDEGIIISLNDGVTSQRHLYFIDIKLAKYWRKHKKDFPPTSKLDKILKLPTWQPHRTIKLETDITITPTTPIDTLQLLWTIDHGTANTTIPKNLKKHLLTHMEHNIKLKLEKIQLSLQKIYQ